MAAGGTDNHLFLWDLRDIGLNGVKMERACDLAGITLNKNTVVGDKSAMSPGEPRSQEWPWRQRCTVWPLY